MKLKLIVLSILMIAFLTSCGEVKTSNSESETSTKILLRKGELVYVDGYPFIVIWDEEEGEEDTRVTVESLVSGKPAKILIDFIEKKEDYEKRITKEKEENKKIDLFYDEND